MSTKRLGIRCLLPWVAAGAALFAVGCGGSDNGSSGGTSASKTTSTEPVTLTIWDGGGFDKNAFKAANADYMKAHPNVTIKRVIQPAASYNTLLRTAVSAQKGPDAFMSFATPLIFDFKRGIEPLSDLVTKEDRENLIGWKNVSTNLQESGTPYAIPFTGQGTVFYYNKALFKKAGLDPAKPPQTWPELLGACTKLKAAGITPIVAGWKDGYYGEWWMELLASQYQTESELADGQAKPKWNTPAMRKAMQLVKDLDAEKCFTPSAEGINLFPDAINNFKSAKGAMFVGLAASAVNWSEFRTTKIGKDIGTFRAPLVPGGLWTEPRMNYGPGNSWVITRWSKNKQATYDYLSYMASAAVQDKLFSTVGAFPNNRKSRPVTDDPVGAELLKWATTTDVFLGQTGLIRANVEAVFDKAIPQVVSGTKSIDDALAALDAEQAKAPPVPSS